MRANGVRAPLRMNAVLLTWGSACSSGCLGRRHGGFRRPLHLQEICLFSFAAKPCRSVPTSCCASALGFFSPESSHSERISSAAPKRIRTASRGSRSLRNSPRAMPSRRTSPRRRKCSTSLLREKRSTRRALRRSSIWKTEARSRSEPMNWKWRSTSAVRRSAAGASRARDGPALLEDVVHRLVEDDAEEVFLVAEVEVNRSLGDLCVGRDVRDAGLVEAPPAERPDRRFEDPAALLGVGARRRSSPRAPEGRPPPTRRRPRPDE